MPHALILPPFVLYATAGLGLLLVRLRRKRLGWTLFWASAGALFLLSMPVVARLLLRPVEVRAVVDPAGLDSDVEAIVVLGAGIEPRSPEFGRGSLDAHSLERIRYGAHLARISGLPLLTTGAVLREEADAVAVEMARVAAEELGVPVRWVDDRARNTWENAARAAELLGPDGVERVAVVTHAWHMPRALYSFEQHGLLATAAPTRIRPPFRWELGEFVPSANGLRDSSYALHEWIGMLAYRLGIR